MAEVILHARSRSFHARERGRASDDVPAEAACHCNHSSSRLTRRAGHILFAILSLASHIVASSPASAAYPGANGQITYSVGGTAPGIYLSDGTRLTFQQDGDPTWSADGRRLAFRRLTDNRSIYIVNKDGSGLRRIAAPSQFGTGAAIGGFGWTHDLADPQVAFVVQTTTEGAGIWTATTSGALTQLLSDTTVAGGGLSWSRDGKAVYRCSFRPGTFDFCVYDSTTGARSELPIAFDNWSSPQIPDWSPRGDEIAFSMSAPLLTVVAGLTVFQNQIFTVKPDGTGLRQLTFTEPPTVSGNGCPMMLDFGRVSAIAPKYSPDGHWLIANVSNVQVQNVNTFCTARAYEGGIYIMPASGGTFTAVHESLAFASWRPIPHGLTFQIYDGHQNPLDGLKVELCRTAGCEQDTDVIDGNPTNSYGGSYTFEEVVPGDFVLRATLIDKSPSPAFDIRYAPSSGSYAPAEAAWMEYRLMIDVGDQSYTINFDQSDQHMVGYYIPSEAGDKNDDLATIFYRTRQFVEWVKLRLTKNTGTMVSLFAFAHTDPTGCTSDPVRANEAYYCPSNASIVMGTLSSDYRNRDGVVDVDGTSGAGEPDNDAPENGEWHEFTHHLYHSFVTTGDSCDPHFVNHAGYDNPDTCDSMDEGFAAFLPTLAARDIDGGSDAEYDDSGHDLDAFKFKPWGYRSGTSDISDPTMEEMAVAGLLWDLVDRNADTVETFVIGSDGLHRPVDYTDTISMTVAELWNALVTHHAATVVDLRAALGQPAVLTIDLDGLSPADVAPIDVPFLMHGFFPIDSDDEITDTHFTYHYRIGNTTPRNATVGRTDHVRRAVFGAIVKTLIPRSDVPSESGANVEIAVRDAAGVPIDGATINFTIAYPRGTMKTTTRRLGSGERVLVHLELPPYFDYLLPTGAPLPPCDPTHDYVVNVTIRAEVNGVVSNESPTFDNCTYFRAIATAMGPAALSFTLTVPVVSPASYSLVLSQGGTGSGTVIGGGSYTAGQTATVSAVPASGSTFGSWSGPNASECASGVVVMDANKSCTAIFTQDTSVTYDLTLNTFGNGSGQVAGEGSYSGGQTADVSAVPDTGSTFSGWSGSNAAECATGSVVMNADKTCTATFTLNSYTLTLLTGGSGSGSVTGAGTYNFGQTAGISATATAGSTFAGWSGSNGEECTTGVVLMDGHKSCTATFSLVGGGTMTFVGFFPPVDNAPTWNSVKAGRGIPVKFSLEGDHGLDIFAAGSPVSGAISCNVTASVTLVESTVTAGESSLTYDPTTDQYTYIWKTEKAWAGQCRQLEVRLRDGSSHVANFEFAR